MQPVTPVRGKPKRRKAFKEGLYAKLRQYEEMLKSYRGVIEPSDHDNSISDVETVSELDLKMVKDTESCNKSSSSPLAFDETKTRLVTKKWVIEIF